MKVLLLTSSTRGTAAHHLPYLMENDRIEEITVVLNKNEVNRNWKFFKRKIRKTLDIGPLGVLNGLKMRKWYGEGVGRYTRIEDLRDACRTHEIPLHEVERINSSECQRVFKELSPDIAISLGNGYIGSKIFTIPTHGMLNIHHEVLPEYQNAQSVIWQLHNGSDTTGYTIHRIDKSIDTGDIVYQEELPISFKDDLSETVSSTVAELYNASARALNLVLSDLDQYLSGASPQGNGGHYTTPSWSQMNRIRSNHSRLKKHK